MTKLTATYFLLLSFCITGFITKVKQAKRRSEPLTGKFSEAAKARYRMDSIYEEKYFEATVGISEKRVIAVP